MWTVYCCFALKSFFIQMIISKFNYRKQKHILILLCNLFDYIHVSRLRKLCHFKVLPQLLDKFICCFILFSHFFDISLSPIILSLSCIFHSKGDIRSWLEAGLIPFFDSTSVSSVFFFRTKLSIPFQEIKKQEFSIDTKNNFLCPNIFFYVAYKPKSPLRHLKAMLYNLWILGT